MRKRKLPQLLEPGIRLHFLVMAVFACICAVINWKVGVTELIVTVLLILYYHGTNKSRKQEILEYISSVTSEMDEATKDTMLQVPLPMVIFRPENDDVIWSNERFLEMTGEKEHLFDMKITATVPAFSSRWLMEGKNVCPEEVAIGARRFMVFGHLLQTEDKGTHNYLATTYWVEVTALADVRDRYTATRPVVAILTLDNYDELTTGTSDHVKSTLINEINQRLEAWTQPTGGLFCRLDRNRYLFVFENRYLMQFTENKFSILDTVREVSSPSGLAATLSIGIGEGGDTLQELMQFASLSTEMALSRGGDQAVIKNPKSFDFYGGRTKELERRTKVKSRVMANAMGDLIADASQVFVMGHQSPDLDCLGAAAGICAIARKKEVAAYIIHEPGPTPCDQMMKRLLEAPEYKGALLTPTEALAILDGQTLLVVVDTSRPEQTLSPELLEACTKVAVVDHHRRAATYITDTVLNFHEPYASSASELVTELLQYLAEGGDLLRVEAEAVLAGLVLDTKQFTIRTGSRTFEAAAYLRRAGADTEEVKKLFRNDLSGVIMRYSIIQNAKVYRAGIAIATAEQPVDRVTAAQAADELLNVSNIEATFVLFPDAEGRVLISARSIGEINVQVILEPLGGGGNAATAGAQLAGTTVDAALASLKQTIDHYVDQE